MEKPKLSTVRDIVLIGGVVLLLAQFILPAPFNPGYIFKWLFYTPTFVCVDGVYSFAANAQGACAGHKGIHSRFQR